MLQYNYLLAEDSDSSLLHNAHSTGKYCVVDFCATMAESHAQKGAKQYLSCGYACYVFFSFF
jgi:hypothetical protein